MDNIFDWIVGANGRVLKLICHAIAIPVKFVWDNVPGGKMIVASVASAVIAGSGYMLVSESESSPERDTGALIDESTAMGFLCTTERKSRKIGKKL